MYGTIPIAASFSRQGMRHDWLAAFTMASILLNPQLKTVIDRFCAFGSRIHMRNMKSAFLSVAWNDDWTMDAIREHYLTLVRYLNLQDMGMVLGTSCGTPSQSRRSRYPQAAYELGKKLR